MLTPEESTLVQNIEAMIGQLKQMSGATEEPVAMAEDEIIPPEMVEGEEAVVEGEEEEEVTMTDDTEDDKVNKASGSDGTTASDNVEPRLEDDLPELTQENLQVVKQLVKKGVIKLTKPAERAQKSRQQMRSLTQSIHDLTVVVKSMMAEQKQTGDAVASIIGGMDIGQEIKKSMNSKKRGAPVRKSQRPVLSTDMNQVLEEIQKQTGIKVEKSGGAYTASSSSTPSTPNGQRQEARKSLAGIMPTLFASSKRI